MAEIEQYSKEELEFAETKLKILSRNLAVDDVYAEAVKIAIWCIEREQYGNMDSHWKGN